VASLSGGEKNRLLLAKTLAHPTNLLILDEPTNDLDMDTLDLLQDVLSDYQGTLLLVSHDRDFLDRLVTSTIVMEGNADVREYPGGYSDYVRQRKNRIDGPKSNTGNKGKSVSSPPKIKKSKGKKLSFKDQYALDNLPKEMDILSKKIETLQAKLAQGDFYSKDLDGFNATNKDLETKVKKLAKKEERWLDLEMLKDEL
jgi:ATP-binding cassette subfamily F protein uup